MIHVQNELSLSLITTIPGGWLFISGNYKTYLVRPNGFMHFICEGWYPTLSNGDELLIANGTKFRAINSEGNIVKAGRGFIKVDKKRNYLSKIISHMYDSMISNFLGIKKDQFGVLIQSKETKESKLLVLPCEENLKHTSITAFSYDELTVIVGQQGSNNYFIIDNPLV